MPGAIIPDDWDGSTFKCNRIFWPSSEKWTAILYGQITEPEWTSFWDAETGDQDEAIEAVNDAEEMTIPEIYTEDCDVIPGIPVPAFYVRNDADQVISAATWTTVLWNLTNYQFNNPNFSFPLNAHVPTNEDLMGLWHYDVNIRFLTGTLVRARAMKAPSSVLKSWATSSTSTGVGMSFDNSYDVGGDQLTIQVWSQVANTIRQVNGYTRYQGHFIGPVV